MSIKLNNKLVLFSLTFLLFFFNFITTCKASTTTTYDMSKKDVVISKSGNYIITGTSTKNTITINKGVTANISLKNVSIHNTTEKKETFDIKSGATVYLTLYGTNKIESTHHQGSAIHVPYGAKLDITKKSTGKISAIAGAGAGIGGSVNDPKGETGTITINGGTIYAKGGYNGCGIGGGGTSRYGAGIYSWDYIGGGDITINGGNVTAIGGDDSETGGCAGIGGASLTRQGKITITGGIVTASSKEAGIGGESDFSKGNKITISGGVVTAKGEHYAAGIGNSLNPTGTTVTITGGTVTAKGDYGNRTLYAAYVADTPAARNASKSYDIAAEKIVISGGNVLAYNLNKKPINAKGKNVYHALINCKNGNITKITLDKTIYGSKDMVSKGYLSLYIPNSYLNIIVKSGDKILHNAPIYSGNDIRGNAELTASLNLDISKGNIEIIKDLCIYQNKIYRSNFITITGTTDRYQVFVHNNNTGLQTFILEDVEVNYEDSGKKDFMVLDNDISLNLHVKGTNTLTLGNQSRGFYVGHDASLNFTGTDQDSLFVKTGEGTSAIYTNYGNVNQYGGNLNFDLGDNSAAIHVGNYGTFSLYDGKFEVLSKKGSIITGLSILKVYIHGGTLLGDIIGVVENGNEEVPNYSHFTMTGGEVKATRLVFNKYTIHNGSLNVSILGSGTGCDVTMYGGNIEIGAYIDNTYEKFETDVMNEKIYGGTVNARNDVPMDELLKLKIDIG